MTKELLGSTVNLHSLMQGIKALRTVRKTIKLSMEEAIQVDLMLKKYDQLYANCSANSKKTHVKKKNHPKRVSARRRKLKERDEAKEKQRLGFSTPKSLGSITNPRPLPGSYGSGTK